MIEGTDEDVSILVMEKKCRHAEREHARGC
jgi:hypothetical protein